MIEGPGFTFTAPHNTQIWIGFYETSERTEGSNGCSEHVAFRVGTRQSAASLFLCGDTGADATRRFPNGSTIHEGEAVTGFYPSIH